MTIFANFTWGEVPDADTLVRLINYNDSNVRGRAYAFAESVGIDFQVILGEGAGAPYLTARVGEFSKILADFVAHMKN